MLENLVRAASMLPDGLKSAGNTARLTCSIPTRNHALCAVSSAFEDAPDSFEAGRHITLSAERLRLVIAATNQLIGKILLRDHADLVIVRILVSLAMAETLCARIVGVTDRLGHATKTASANVGNRRINGHIGRVRLRRRGEVGGGLCQRNAAFRHADKSDRVGGCNGNHEGLGVSQTNIFCRRDHQTARNEAWVLPRLNHAGKVVNGRINVRATDGLNEGTDHVVVLITLAVIPQQGTIDGLGNVLRRNYAFTVIVGGDDSGGFQRRQCATSITRREVHERVECFRFDGELAVEPSDVADGALNENRQVFIGQRRQRQQQRTRKQR